MSVVHNLLILLDPQLYFLLQRVPFDKYLLSQSLDGSIPLYYFLFEVLNTILSEITAVLQIVYLLPQALILKHSNLELLLQTLSLLAKL